MSHVKQILFPTVTLLIVLGFQWNARAQSESEPDSAQKHIAHARGLAAAGDLDSAAHELEAIRVSVSDNSVRQVTRILLASVYLEKPDYTRARMLLDDAFNARSGQSEEDDLNYFSLAGQVVKGARAHLDRYRLVGLDVVDRNLPSEADKDLDALRWLLDHLIEQAKSIREEENNSMNSVALLEDSTGVRITLSRDNKERVRWQRELAWARQRLAVTERHAGNAGAADSVTDPSSAGKAGARNFAAASSYNNESHPNTPAKSSGVNNPAPPRSSPDQNSPVVIGALTEKATEKVPPAYPDIAKSAHISGVVTVYLVVDQRGTVEDVQRTSGPELLKAAAEDAARHWKFRPTYVGGQAVRVSGFISFNFTL